MFYTIENSKALRRAAPDCQSKRDHPVQEKKSGRTCFHRSVYHEHLIGLLIFLTINLRLTKKMTLVLL